MAADRLERWLQTIGSRRVLEALIDSFPGAAVFAVDADQTVVAWNEGAVELLGYQPDEVIGEHCRKANRCQQCMLGCGIADRGAIDDVALTLYSASGTPVHLRKTARGFFSDSNEFLGGIEVLVPDEGPAADPPTAGSDPGDAALQVFHGLASTDPTMHRVFQTCRNVAETDANALIRGESGTGKELVARALHAESSRATGPFVAINCAALTPTLMESELFGHVKGAFTGAVKNRSGIFEQAHRGTLFLDEVAELPLELQAKLLRVLEQHAVVPVGGSDTVEVDVRVIAATHRSLREGVRQSRFREDLMYRLRVVPIFLPPLRERRGDVELLLRRFIDEKNASGPRRVHSIAPAAMRALLDHSWPGNVRELKNVVEYAFAVGRGPELLLTELPPELSSEPRIQAHARDTLGLTTIRRKPSPEDEARRIRNALAQSGGHIGKAAEALEMSRPTLWRKRKKYGI
jgi:transcriptional regulator with PAS, ATPase and Fis domain